MRVKQALILIVTMIIFTTMTAFAENQSFRYFQDFSSATLPSDGVFVSDGYSVISVGQIKQKIKDGSGGFQLVTDGLEGGLYFSADYTFVYDIQLKLIGEDSDGNKQIIHFATNIGKIYDTDDNDIGEISEFNGMKLRKIGLMIFGKKAFLYMDGNLIGDMNWNLKDLKILTSQWINDTDADFRPLTDNILLSQNSSDFVIPSEYTKEPLLTSTIPSDNANAVVIYDNTVVLNFENALSDDVINEQNYSITCNAEAVTDFSVTLSQDKKRLEIICGSKLMPVSEYVVTARDISTQYGVKLTQPIVLRFATANGERVPETITWNKNATGIESQVYVVNERADEAEASIIVCLCVGTEQDYNIVSYKEFSKIIAPGDKQLLTVDLDCDINADCFAKVFVWESIEAMQPLCESIVCK